ncbi:MAG TPA: prolyl oligopeptidase family serine peptidase [Vicinamibacterales bacterium]|jgi:dipeptidyl aminopeptidase/acylaminoacyl peptidase|nr:prolyl oligopeptidase family serine peptidase [Vicinamibacterales bacterium]
MHISSRVTCGVAALACVLATAHPTTAPGKPFELTVDSIMRGPKLVGYPQTGLRWSGDSSRLYFEWRRPGDEEAATYIVDRGSDTPRKLTDDERRSAPPVNGAWDKAHRRVLFADQGDIAMVDSIANTRRQITRMTGAESSPRWARRESAVTFTRDNNLFIVPLDTGAIEQLTDVQSKKRDPRETDSQKFVKAEEQKLIEHTRLEAEKKKKAEDKEKARALPKFDLAERQSVSDLQLSPDGKDVFLLVVERTETAKRPNVPNYVTESSYTEDIPARTFVGDAQDKRTLAVMNLETGKSVPVDSEFAGKREVRWSMPIVSDDGSLAVASARATDNKDRWLVSVDAGSGKSRVVDALHDDAWVREPGGGFGSAEPSAYGWLPDQKRIWFLSERDGWMHLYTVDATAANQTAKQLTLGKWEIESAELSADKKRFYFRSTEVHPGERHLYSMSVDGGERTKLTSMTGGNAGEVSPDDSTIGLIHSASTKPHEIYLMPNRPGAAARQVTTTPTDEWRSFKWIEPQLITYKTRDGVDVYARLYTPEMIGARRDPAAPAVVFVHGAGYAQNAHKYWPSYYREFMFHNVLASKGYVVLDPDYRASSGYGRDWRTAIYRHMGGKDLDDVVDGAKYLVEKQKVNAKRIGVYGGSYGGFITLMAMFTSPDTFAAGAALRPVTDWSHYNHNYTSNILNEPNNDPEAYRRSSPIYFAEGLKGSLLILHGMVDTNVLFQDSVRLAQRLIELRKEHWSFAPYPVENHGFEEETSWADEYKRILKLFEDTLKGPGTNDARRAS